MEHRKELKKIEINTNDPWANKGMQILIDAPDQYEVKAIIVEPYNPVRENDEDVEHGEVFWCERLDKTEWSVRYTEGIKHGRKLLAVHHMYMFKPLYSDWDSEENNNE